MASNNILDFSYRCVRSLTVLGLGAFCLYNSYSSYSNPVMATPETLAIHQKYSDEKKALGLEIGLPLTIFGLIDGARGFNRLKKDNG